MCRECRRKKEKESSSCRHPIFFCRYSMSVHFLLFSVQVPSSNTDFLFSIFMSFVSHLTFIFFLVSNVCLANISEDFMTKKYSFERHQQCRSVGEICRKNQQCCAPLICSMLQGSSSKSFELFSIVIESREKSLFTIVK